MNKKALSNLVAYVLLIGITISLSVMVYGWLKFYVESEEVIECPSNVNIVISGYECSSGAGGNLTVRLKNKGMFTIDGFVLRVHNRTDAEFGIYTFDDVGDLLKPGEEVTKVYDFSNPSFGSVGNITLIDVQPFLNEGERAVCSIHASQVVTCI